MHYYQFNIGDYASHTSRLSLIEDLAYRRMLDMYYLSESPLIGSDSDIARDIGLSDYNAEVSYVLEKFFTRTERGCSQKRIDLEIKKYNFNSKNKSKAGKASGKARRDKASKGGTPVQHLFNTCSTPVEQKGDSVELNINHKPLTNNHKTIKEKRPVELKLNVDIIFEFWKESLNHKKSVMDVKRKTLITKALKNYSVDDLKDAITGCTKTPHNMGDNDRNAIYDGLHIIFKDSDNIERFISNSKNKKISINNQDQAKVAL